MFKISIYLHITWRQPGGGTALRYRRTRLSSHGAAGASSRGCSVHSRDSPATPALDEVRGGPQGATTALSRLVSTYHPFPIYPSDPFLNNCDSRYTSHDNALSHTSAHESEGPGPESLQGAPCPLRAHIARFRARKVRSRRVPKRERKGRQGVLFKLLLQGGGLFPAGWRGGVGTSTR